MQESQRFDPGLTPNGLKGNSIHLVHPSVIKPTWSHTQKGPEENMGVTKL